MTSHSSHVDTFTRDNLPPRNQWPEFLFELPELDYPASLNCAAELLDANVAEGRGDRIAFRSPDQAWTYAELQDKADRIARVLTEDFGIVPGNRVLIRGFNSPMFVACWFAVAKAGAVVVATMPLLRAKELAVIADKAEVSLALCDKRLDDELEKGADKSRFLSQRLYWGEGGALEDRMQAHPGGFEAVATAADETVLIAFTSGTTGNPKGTMHFHRDILASCDTYARHILAPNPDDIFIGSPPIAFTFGLGGLVLFPMRFGASAVLLEAAPPDKLLDAICEHRATCVFTAPTAYRAMAEDAAKRDLSFLRHCVSAGETLPLPTFELWEDATGNRILDGIGATEMLHIFIGAPPDRIKPGATGIPVPGYHAMVVDEDMNPLKPGEIGRLAVKGPTGCRYLADPRQTTYVQDGWNVTGDAYRIDEDGYFHFAARADDMIVSAGYNISGPEVEEALLEHDAVAECACVASPDEARGFVVKAFVVLRSGTEPGETLAQEMKDFVKARIAPYKYPRRIEFTDALPRTATGKIQRFRLREAELEKQA